MEGTYILTHFWHLGTVSGHVRAPMHESPGEHLALWQVSGSSLRGTLAFPWTAKAPAGRESRLSRAQAQAARSGLPIGTGKAHSYRAGWYRAKASLNWYDAKTTGPLVLHERTSATGTAPKVQHVDSIHHLVSRGRAYRLRQPRALACHDTKLACTDWQDFASRRAVSPPSLGVHKMATHKILVSPGFGAGWTTWASDKEMSRFMLTHPGLIAAVEANQHTDAHSHAGKAFLAECEARFGDVPYMGGADSLTVVTVSGPFWVTEYDGSESVIERDTFPWTDLDKE